MRAAGEFVQLKGDDEAVVNAGDLFVMETPGGGGYGFEKFFKGLNFQ